MRTIKFRAWSKETKAMVCPDYIDCDGTCFDYSHTKGMNADDDYILMQFTGLLDKNGKEIYEGDICKDDDGIIMMLVTFQEGVFCFLPKPYRPLREYENLEVIGNIWENKELLGE